MPDSTATIRAWAQDNGFDVGDRGRLSDEVRTAYGKANHSAKPKPAAKKAAPVNKPAAKAAPKPAPKPAATPAEVTAPEQVAPEPVAPEAPAVPSPPADDFLSLRVASLEKQLAGLEGRLELLEKNKKTGFRRRAK